MWVVAYPEQGELVDVQDLREALDGSTIDDHEVFTRRQLTVPNLVLGGIECRGRHHTVAVRCKYAVVPGEVQLRIA